jgi:peptide-methionine (S)-S-oxide reductase
VGYAGGVTKNPTYHNLGDHSETIQIEFDPEIISYEELLKVFWQNHDPFSRPWSRQYRSAIIYHNEVQKSLAMESLKREQSRKGAAIYTEILPASRFYSAEDYHQKYYLRQRKEIVEALKGVFHSEDDFTDSTAAARLNGYFGGYLSLAGLEAQMGSLGLPAEKSKGILDCLRAGSPNRLPVCEVR